MFLNIDAKITCTVCMRESNMFANNAGYNMLGLFANHVDVGRIHNMIEMPNLFEQ